MTRAGGPGAPREGESGSVAPAGPRLAAFGVDIVLSALVAGIFTAPELPRNRSLLVFAVLYFGFTVLAQQTPGMRLVKLRVVRVDGLRQRQGEGGCLERLAAEAARNLPTGG